MSFSRRLPLSLGLAAIGLVAACSSLGTPADQDVATGLWGEIQGYQGWAQFEKWPGIQKGRSSVHGKYVATYLDPVAASDAAGLPVGSLLVKANYSRNDANSLEALTVMKRIEGFDPENGDWFWARFEPNGELTHAGKVAMCADCHFGADGDDFSFLND